MRRLLQFLVENPILLLVLVGWLAGLVGQIGKAAKKARERGQPAPAEPPPADAEPELDAEAIAREMRRILRQPEPASPPPLPSPAPEARRPVGIERPPQPITTTTASRRLPIHVAPHVGESIQQRAQRQRSKVGEHALGSELGNLGGRVHQATTRRSQAHRYALNDLKQAFVLSEILGPPLAMRPDRQV